MPNAADMIITAAVMFTASTIYSTVGFGIGISATPLLLLIFEPQTSVLIINTSGLVVFSAVAWQTRESLSLRQIVPMAAAGLAGVPVGVAVLTLVSSTILRLAIAALILVLATVVALNLETTARGGRWSGLGAGLVGSAFVNATGIGGPIVALGLVARRWPRNTIRGVMAAFFLVIGVTGVIGYAVAGLYTVDRGILIAVAIGPILSGFTLSNLLTRGMDEALFRRAVVAVILVTSSLVLGREVARVLG